MIPGLARPGNRGCGTSVQPCPSATTTALPLGSDHSPSWTLWGSGGPGSPAARTVHGWFPDSILSITCWCGPQPRPWVPPFSLLRVHMEPWPGTPSPSSPSFTPLCLSLPSLAPGTRQMKMFSLSLSLVPDRLRVHGQPHSHTPGHLGSPSCPPPTCCLLLQTILQVAFKGLCSPLK